MIRIMKYGEVPNSELFARNMPTMNVTDTVAEIIRNVRDRLSRVCGGSLDLRSAPGKGTEATIILPKTEHS